MDGSTVDESAGGGCAQGQSKRQKLGDSIAEGLLFPTHSRSCLAGTQWHNSYCQASEGACLGTDSVATSATTPALRPGSTKERLHACVESQCDVCAESTRPFYAVQPRDSVPRGSNTLDQSGAGPADNSLNVEMETNPPTSPAKLVTWRVGSDVDNSHPTDRKCTDPAHVCATLASDTSAGHPQAPSPIGARVDCRHARRDKQIAAVAAAIRRADNILVLAGAGFSAGSQAADGTRIPDYRSTNSFTTAFGPLAARGFGYRTIATSQFFDRHPETAWGFYAHRMRMYKEAQPHEGYRLLRDLIGDKSHFVVTSNVDGFFVRSGFAVENVCEIHGSLARVQCARHAAHGVWRSDKILRETTVDSSTFTIDVNSVPQCRAARCKEAARPNVLLFSDHHFVPKAVEIQRARYSAWAENCAEGRESVLVFEIGAGTAVPTIREMFSSCYLDLTSVGCAVNAVRINTAPASSDVGFVGNPDNYYRLELDALAALTAINGAMATNVHVD